MKSIIIILMIYSSTVFANSVESETDIQKFNKMNEEDQTAYLLSWSDKYINGDKNERSPSNLTTREYLDLKKQVNSFK